MEQKKLISISKRLSKILRHQLNDYSHDENGFVELEILMKLFGKDVDINIIKQIVSEDKKSRFELVNKKINQKNKYFIRANQGHSTGELNDEEMLTPLKSQIDGCFHATFSRNLESIKKNGLSRMERKHIHIAESENAKSGRRETCDIKIFINMKLALDEGIKFYQSKNKCILTPGDEKGFLSPKYFLKIEKILKTKNNV
tara:strand:+ start:4364 stop:4963 length:600 start_codon:yes stop_codon:yes gene_type:complete